MTNSELSKDPPHTSRGIVESFLQNVVVLDDRLVRSQVERQPRGSESELIVAPDYPETPTRDDYVVNGTHDGGPLNADSLINTFADMGVVCAVLNPLYDGVSGSSGNGPSLERATRAAVRADIVVLDWNIGGRGGEFTQSVIGEILSKDSRNRRLRLIAIYTGEKDLKTINSEVRTTLQGFYESESLKTTSPSRMSKGPVHVIILAKEGTIDDYNPNCEYQEIGEEELPDRLVREFVSITSGLLPNVALAGIAGIRNNVYRILESFDRELDVGYLVHRLLLPHPPDAEVHLVEALGAEMLSLLEEKQPGTYADIGAIERWLGNIDEVRLSSPFQRRKHVKPIEQWVKLLLCGLEEVVDSLALKKKVFMNRAGEFLVNGSCLSRRANRRFSSLLKLKTKFPEYTPRLSLGSVVYLVSDGAHDYYLCLQPKCDSIRLESKTGFPFVPLVDHGSGKRLCLALQGPSEVWKELDIAPYPSELIVPVFCPENGAPKGVVATKDDSGAFYFEDVDGIKYWWIAEMKDEHAFGVVGEIASALSRPGPNDAEWLRRGLA